MSEVQTKVETYSVDYKCDECKEGFMRPTGTMLCCEPPLYPHNCDECHHQANFTRHYPYQKLVPVKDKS